MPFVADEEQPQGKFIPDPETPRELRRKSLLAEQAKEAEVGKAAQTRYDVLNFLEPMVEPLTASGMLNQPARLIGNPDLFQANTPIINIPEPSGETALAGLGKLGARTLSSLTTPEMIVEAPAAGVSRLVRALFGAQMISHLPDQVVDAVKTLLNPKSTPAEKVLAVGEPTVNAAMITLLAKERPTPPRVPGPRPPERTQFPVEATPEEAALFAQEFKKPTEPIAEPEVAKEPVAQEQAPPPVEAPIVRGEVTIDPEAIASARRQQEALAAAETPEATPAPAPQSKITQKATETQTDTQIAAESNEQLNARTAIGEERNAALAARAAAALKIAQSIKAGDVIIQPDGTRQAVKSVDGQVITFEDGSFINAKDLASDFNGGSGEVARIEKPSAKIQPVGMGGAVPSEFEVTPKTPTGIKNATVDAERQSRGLPPAAQVARRGFGEVWDSAMAKIDQDPGLPDRLIAELREKPRALTDAEDATLLHRQIDLQNEYGKATRDLAQAYDDGRMADVASEKLRVQDLSDRLLDLYNINKAVGTETGRGLNARKMMANEDFSLARMELEKRAANDGAPLTDVQRTEITALHNKIAETQRRYDDYVAKTEAAERQRIARELIEKAPQPRVNPYIIQVAERIVGALDKRADAARARLKAKMARTSAGVDPTILADLAEIGASHLGHVGLDFAKWSARMIEDVGEWSKEHLEEVFKRSQALIDADVASKVPDKSRREGVKDALQGYKTRLERQTQELQKRIESGDFAKRVQNKVELDPEAIRLKFENEKVKRQYQEGLLKDKLARRTTGQKVFDRTVETIQATRALKTSFDLSAVLRQGGFIAFGNPVRAARAIPDMFRALRSEQNQFRVDQEILHRPNYPLYKQSGLYLAERGHTLSKMEEAYMSNWADKIPGVAASQRAYTTFLNRLRADSFDAMVKSLGRESAVTNAEASAIANFVNVATGRGKIGLSDRAAVGLNTVFFAPRYVASRFQLLGLQPFYRGTARTRIAIATEYAKTLAGATIVYTLSSLAGAEIEKDPRSAEFGKIRWGKERIDPLFGLLQVTTLSGRLTSGETKTGKGKIVPIRGKVPFGASTASDIVARFLRTKLAPLPSFALDVASGENVVGEKVSLGESAANLVTPISFGDIYQAMKNQGVPSGLALAVLSIFGMGLQSYPEPGQKPNK